MHFQHTGQHGIETFQYSRVMKNIFGICTAPVLEIW